MDFMGNYSLSLFKPRARTVHPYSTAIKKPLQMERLFARKALKVMAFTKPVKSVTNRANQ
jgi:hypothetical protein